MPAVVQAVCPKCKRALCIPAEWLGQAVRCTGCGQVMVTRAAAPVATPVLSPRPPLPAAQPIRPAPRAPRPAPPPAALPATGSVAFLNLDGGPASLVRVRRPSGGWWRGPLLLVCILVLAGIGTAVAWPHLGKLVATRPDPQPSADDDSPPPDSHAERKDPPIVWDQPRKDPAPKADPPTKSDPPPKKDPPPQTEPPPKKDPPPKTEPPKKEMPKQDPPPKQEPPPKKDPPREPNPPQPRPTGEFPRRMLAVSVNNYLYANPINYGIPLRNAHNVRTLLDRFTATLRVPMEQIVELSDAAPMGQARPPVKTLVQKVIADFLAGSRAQDRVILLLIAHTVEISDDLFIVPVDGDLETKDTLIPLAWLREQLAACRSRQKVLILDTCRLNPTRGVERPGSGPMGAKLDAALLNPPPGVQIWSTCVAGQFSYELENQNLNNGVFLEALYEVLTRDPDGPPPKPEDPLPLAGLVEQVNARMKAMLDPLKKVQTSRLGGKEPEGGAAYDPREPLPAKLVLPATPPSPAGGPTADLAELRAILKEIDVPPLKMTRDDQLLRPEAMPPFAAKALEPYKADAEMTGFRQAVLKARDVLNQQLRGKRLREVWTMEGDENRHKQVVKDYQEKEVARTMRELDEALQDLLAAGKEGRAKEPSKRWQAHYDYILARLEAQMAYLYEYNSLLGQMRKDLPPKGPTGWRLASQEKLQGDAAGKKLAKDATALLQKLAKEHPGTPWEVMARRDRLTTLGLEWQPN